jgi:Protein of unknown function (DUF2840)
VELLVSTHITYTIIKETRLEHQIGNKIRAGNYCHKIDLNRQDRMCLILPKQLIAMQRWQGGLFGTTKWILYIFRTGSNKSCKNLVPGVFPKVDMLFFCLGATRVKRTLKLIDSLTNSGIEFAELKDEYWLHQHARIQTGQPLVLPCNALQNI